ncbi:MAG TPA: GntR family transcriptional regulator [Anaerovoracaceae bacterium]|nr:GntR family transcriptional regulator [Anaerovoracaceae bacterium]
MDIRINKTCSEQVFETLKGRIVAGEYSPNDRLLYNNIANELGVSISPVREAFLNLEKIGLVTINPRKGVYVRQISYEDNFEYSLIRFALESLAVERICEIGLSSESVAVLNAINNAFHDSLNSNGEGCHESIHLDNDFHRQIVLESQMKRLFELTQIMPLANLRALTNNQKCFLNRGEQIYQTHINIINALVQQDAAIAKSFLYQNIIIPMQEIASSVDANENI